MLASCLSWTRYACILPCPCRKWTFKTVRLSLCFPAKCPRSLLQSLLHSRAQYYQTNRTWFLKFVISRHWRVNCCSKLWDCLSLGCCCCALLQQIARQPTFGTHGKNKHQSRRVSIPSNWKPGSSEVNEEMKPNAILVLNGSTDGYKITASCKCRK